MHAPAKVRALNIIKYPAVFDMFATHARESQVSYVSFSGDVLKFFRKRMDVNNFRYICGFRESSMTENM